MRAFSLVELLVGMLLGLMLIMGFIGFSHRMSNTFLTWRRQQQAHSQLLASTHRIREHLSMADPSFWEQFPATNQVVHPADHIHGANHFTQSCPDSDFGGCLVFWDLHPKTTTPLDYLVLDMEWPLQIKLTPKDETLPIGPDDSITPGTAALLISQNHTIPFVISDVAGDWLYLLPPTDQPWTLPQVLAEESFQVVVLGDLTVSHIALVPSQGRHATLRFQPWMWKEDGWKPGRSQTGDTHLVNFHFRKCELETPDRLTLVAQPHSPAKLTSHLVVAGVSYQEEVFFETLSF